MQAHNLNLLYTPVARNWSTSLSLSLCVSLSVHQSSRNSDAPPKVTVHHANDRVHRSPWFRLSFVLSQQIRVPPLDARVRPPLQMLPSILLTATVVPGEVQAPKSKHRKTGPHDQLSTSFRGHVFGHAQARSCHSSLVTHACSLIAGLLFNCSISTLQSSRQ